MDPADIEDGIIGSLIYNGKPSKLGRLAKVPFDTFANLLRVDLD